MARKSYAQMKTTDHPKIYREARKEYLAKQPKGINCSFCPYHSKENATRVPRHISWKKSSKRRKQYKPI